MNNAKDANDNKPIRFSEEALKMIDEGVASLERGEKFSQEEALEFARTKAREWLPTRQNRSA
ncbi:MAG TPA: hypothetical protein VGL56_08800 [Fimbriimonadaceae bacterium]|jgi:hypothetical protein